MATVGQNESSPPIIELIDDIVEHAEAVDVIVAWGKAAIPGIHAYHERGLQMVPQPRCAVAKFWPSFADSRAASDLHHLACALDLLDGTLDADLPECVGRPDVPAALAHERLPDATRLARAQHVVALQRPLAALDAAGGIVERWCALRHDETLGEAKSCRSPDRARDPGRLWQA